MLHDLLTENRGELIARCQAKGAARRALEPPDSGLDHGVPVFLDQVIDTLRVVRARPTIRESATQYGNELMRRGFTVDQVVHSYGDVCQAVTDLAVELGAPITTDEFRTLNRCLDDAIADAVTEHGRQRERFVADAYTERLELVAKLRYLIDDASRAFAAIASGSVDAAWSSGAKVERNLKELRKLVDRPLTDVGNGSADIS